MPVVSKFAGRGKSKIFKIESEYTFIQTLGVGTYGEVKLASWVSDPSKLVAIKIAKGQTSIHMLKNEAEILKKLNHECYPQFIDFNIDEFTNKAYLIIEYFEGSTLDSYLEDHSFDEVEALNHLKLLTDAIKYLHSNKIAHRDLKPQNIIVTQDNKVKVIDFNISKRFVDRSFDEDEKVSCLNLTSWLLTFIKYADHYFHRIRSLSRSSSHRFAHRCLQLQRSFQLIAIQKVLIFGDSESFSYQCYEELRYYISDYKE